MAKGLEDTALYVYNPLVSLNEVGTDFLVVAPEDFHRFNRQRQENWPTTLNATATHDTKRSEDVRMRINALSGDPQQWEACLKRWSAWNQAKKHRVNGMVVPDPNEEYFLYQTLIGAWPLYKEEMPEFNVRLQEYIIKAAREAKVHTRWIAPNHEHENALTAFAAAILHESEPNEFLDDFQKIQARLAYCGALNSLSQVVLKIASPGVPDFYQGTELWDFSLVDPDNRRPVDFHQRAQLLQEVKIKAKKAPGALGRELLANWQNGAVKLYTTYQALNFRRTHPDLFLGGDYIPITAQGPQSQQVVAFARRQENSWVVVAVARFFTKLILAAAPAYDPALWQDNCLSLPDDAPTAWGNIFTGETIKSLPHEQTKSLDLATLLQNLPVALLYGRAD
jgi:(1->4)-alpha-D-glucan 1-alpha-D-glucosylmutase